jgi:hypothetical protein
MGSGLERCGAQWCSVFALCLISMACSGSDSSGSSSSGEADENNTNSGDAARRDADDDAEEACVALGSTSSSTTSSARSIAPPTEITLPPAGGPFDYQLGCAYPLPAGATVVVRDRLAPADSAAYSICYVNAFQTQPGSDWTGPLDELILRDARGRRMIDPDWPDEYFLDFSTPELRTRLITLVGPWIEGCAAAGFDAVEFDNLDSYDRSNGRLTVEQAEAYATELVRISHENFLAAAQKNAAEHSAQFHALGFDFSIAEECWQYEECDQYTAEYGDRVYAIEYDARAFERGCNAGRAPVPLLRDLDLVAPGDGYVRRECP